MRELHIGDLVIRIPIIQGGMGVGISLSGLASAVAREGGVGVIASAGIEINGTDSVGIDLQSMRDEIHKARALTKGVVGMNIMGVLTDYAKMVRAAAEEKIDIIFSGAGLPLDMPGLLPQGSTTKLVPIVSSARAASLLIRKWIRNYKRAPDALVVEGPKAGGHLGFSVEQINDPAYALESLIPQVVAEAEAAEREHGVKIPVIAAGGIYTGADIAKIMRLGASGVQMATRFVTTDECDADLAFKQTYLDAKEEDIVIIKSPVGMPGRAIRNKFIEEVTAGLRKPFRCAYHCITTCKMGESPYCIALALINAKQGKLRNGFAFAGANAYRATAITSVKKLMATLVEEYEAALPALVPGTTC